MRLLYVVTNPLVKSLAVKEWWRQRLHADCCNYNTTFVKATLIMYYNQLMNETENIKPFDNY